MAAGHAHLYIDGSSRIHRLAPEVKVAAAVTFVFAVAFTRREAIWAFGVDVAALAIVIGTARVPVRAVLRRLVVEVPFVIFAVLLPFLGRGERIEVLGLSLSVGGLWSAWNILAKATIGVLTSVVLASTTPVPDIIRGLERLRVPRTFTAIMAFMVRYLDVIAGELRRIRIALLSRGYAGRWFWQSRPLATSAGALFVRTYERGERVYHAMMARGYAGTMPDLGYRKATAAEWSTSFILPALAALLAVLAWTAT